MKGQFEVIQGEKVTKMFFWGGFNRVIFGRLNHVLTHNWEVEDYFLFKGRLYIRKLEEFLQI